MPCRYCLNWPRCMPAARSISPNRWLSSASVAFTPSPLAFWICRRSSIIWRRICAARRWLQVRAVLHAGAADGERDALLEVEIGDGIVVDTGHHAQTLGRAQCRKQSDDDGEKGAEEQRGHCTDS